MRTVFPIILLAALAACRASGEGTPDAAAAADAADPADAAATADAADPADAAPTADSAPVGDATIAEGAVINEAVVDSNGNASDTTEFLEVLGDPSTDYSALSILQIDGDVGPDGPGKVMSIHAVGTTDASGFWQTGFLQNQLQNGTLTLMLVQGFTGAVDDDLDTNDDGAMETMPWTAVLDAVAFNDGAGTNVTYAGAAVLGMDFGGASRIPDGADGDVASDWVMNQPDTAAVPGLAHNTPGAPNEVEP